MKKYLWKIKGWIFLRIFLNGLYVAAIAAIPYIIKYALDYNYISNDFTSAFKFIGLYLFTAIIGMAFQWGSQISGWKLYQKFYLLIKDDLLWYLSQLQKL